MSSRLRRYGYQTSGQTLLGVLCFYLSRVFVVLSAEANLDPNDPRNADILNLAKVRSHLFVLVLVSYTKNHTNLLGVVIQYAI